MAEFLSPGPCSFLLRRKKLATVTTLSQTLSLMFASLNVIMGKTDMLPRSQRNTDYSRCSGGAPKNKRGILMGKWELALI